jgi:hypothetical protein
MRAAIVENNIVVNVIEVESLDFIEGLVEAPEANIGDVWDGESFTAPPVEPTPDVVPSKVTMRQARLILLANGLLDDVELAIDNTVDEVKRKQARIEWDFSSEVHRNKGLVSELGVALNLTEDQLDQMFIDASKLL